jgi:hypothetical protein
MRATEFACESNELEAALLWAKVAAGVAALRPSWHELKDAGRAGKPFQRSLMA